MVDNNDLIVPHAPVGLQLLGRCRLCEDLITRETADSAGAAANSCLLHCRDATAITPDAASIAHSIAVLEFLGRRKVEASEGTGFTQQMPKKGSASGMLCMHLLKYLLTG